jgi:hypothetical protein
MVMVSPSIVNITDNTFVTYAGANGFANVAYNTTVVGNNTTPTAVPAGLAATTKLDITTGTVVLSDNPSVYALRTSQSINVGGPFSTITLRSGGLIGTGGTIQPNLVFNDGAANIEARIYVNGTLTINGAITANGITKFWPYRNRRRSRGHTCDQCAAGQLRVRLDRQQWCPADQ